MSNNPNLPAPLAALLAAALSGATLSDLAPTRGGFSNLTLAATLNGQPVILKASDVPAKAADLRREARVLTLLQPSGLRCSQPLAMVEGAGWTLLVLERLAGEPGIALYERPVADLSVPLAALGHTLATVHGLALAPPAEPDFDLTTRARITAAALPELALPSALRTALSKALAHPIWQTSPRGLVHGDPGLHNLLWHQETATLLDWEWAGWGPQLLDLAWVAWTLRFRGLPNSLWATLLQSYAAKRPGRLEWSSEAAHALVLGQIAGILVRSAGREGAWQEWLRRAEWTIDCGP